MISGASTRTPNIMRAAPRASARRWRRCATCPRASARRRKRGRGDRAMIDRIARLIGAARRGEARWLAYLFASGLALGTDAGLFLLLLGGGVAPVAASALGYGLGILVHWLASRRLVFADRR